MPGGLRLMRLPIHLQIELARRAGRHASEYSCIGGKRERNVRQFVYLIFAAMAIAATWVISTARSPTTWQPNILQVARSTISLQKPALRPSMIVRVVELK